MSNNKQITLIALGLTCAFVLAYFTQGFYSDLAIYRYFVLVMMAFLCVSYILLNVVFQKDSMVLLFLFFFLLMYAFGNFYFLPSKTVKQSPVSYTIAPLAFTAITCCFVLFVNKLDLALADKTNEMLEILAVAFVMRSVLYIINVVFDKFEPSFYTLSLERRGIYVLKIICGLAIAAAAFLVRRKAKKAKNNFILETLMLLFFFLVYLFFSVFGFVEKNYLNGNVLSYFLETGVALGGTMIVIYSIILLQNPAAIANVQVSKAFTVLVGSVSFTFLIFPLCLSLLNFFSPQLKSFTSANPTSFYSTIAVSVLGSLLSAAALKALSKIKLNRS